LRFNALEENRHYDVSTSREIQYATIGRRANVRSPGRGPEYMEHCREPACVYAENAR
jgi:hypothetical protein